LFVRIAEQWSQVRWTIGVTAIPLDGGRPALIGDPYVDDLRGSECAGFLILIQSSGFPGASFQFGRTSTQRLRRPHLPLLMRR
jgi:hypothetical protein